MRLNPEEQERAEVAAKASKWNVFEWVRNVINAVLEHEAADFELGRYPGCR